MNSTNVYTKETMPTSFTCQPVKLSLEEILEMDKRAKTFEPSYGKNFEEDTHYDNEKLPI